MADNNQKNNSNDDMFNAEELLSLLNEITNESNNNSESKKQEENPDYYPGMIKIASSSLSLSAGETDDEWAKDIFHIDGEGAAKNNNQKHVVAYNLADYSPEIYSDQQLKEIRLGIEHRVQVDEYADELLSGRQMRELRYGLERGIDISIYNNKLFRERQMKEIRIGLQDGLDVSSYAKLMFSATDMHKKRKELFFEKYKGNFDSVSYDYDDKGTGIHVYVEPGLMEAGIVINNNLPEKFTRDDLKALMYSYDIIEGFDERLVPQNLSNLPKGVKIPIMFGKAPVPGKDGYFEYSFPIDEGVKPKINDNGTVDYNPSRVFKNVKRGEIIVNFHPAEKGEVGTTVTGIEIQGIEGVNPDPIKSDDLLMSRDKLSYMAKRDGFVSISKGEIRIMDNLTFKEDITYNNGKIKFDGTVQINGSVRDRAEIYATGDIIVSGFVESATFVAGGDIIVTGGINANDEGSFVAKGNITAGFIENANCDAGGNIEAGYILNSIVIASGVVKTKGKKALICGGRVVGREGVISGVIGSSAGARTYIEVGGNDDENEEYSLLMKDKKNADDNINRIRTVMEEMQQKIGIVQVTKDESYIKLQNMLEIKKEDRTKIEKQLEELDAKRLAKADLSAEAIYQIFENVTIDINGNKLVTKESYGKASFKSQGRRIVIETPDKKN